MEELINVVKTQLNTVDKLIKAQDSILMLVHRANEAEKAVIGLKKDAIIEGLERQCAQCKTQNAGGKRSLLMQEAVAEIMDAVSAVLCYKFVDEQRQRLRAKLFEILTMHGTIDPDAFFTLVSPDEE